MTANEYFEYRNITKLETSEEGCTFEDWSVHSHGFMKYQRDTFDLLYMIFKRFILEEGGHTLSASDFEYFPL